MIQDLRKQWLNVARRLQSAASHNRGAAVLHTRIIVDESSNPIGWNEPEVLRIEPVSHAANLLNMIAPRPIHPLIARLTDSCQLTINKGAKDGVHKNQWYSYIENDVPCAIFSVSSVGEKSSSLSLVWSSNCHDLCEGDKLSQLSWILPMDNQE